MLEAPEEAAFIVYLVLQSYHGNTTADSPVGLGSPYCIIIEYIPHAYIFNNLRVSVLVERPEPKTDYR